jgi:hypothetical protein
MSAGTEIEVRVNESLSSETSQQGERFTGTVTSDVIDRNSGRVLIARGSQVEGRVLSAVPSGRLSSSGELSLSINTIRNGSTMTNVTVEPFVSKGESHTKSNTAKIGGGAALGAIIGAIAGGGKGAAIGAGVGGAAGAGTAAATGKRPAEVKPEAQLKFVTAAETTVSAAAAVPSTPAETQAQTQYPGQNPSSGPSSTPSSSGVGPDSSADAPAPVTDTSDQEPVMHRRDGSTAASPSPTTDNNAGTAATRNTTTTAAATGNTGVSTPSSSTSNSAGNTGSSTQSTTGTTGASVGVGTNVGASTSNPPSTSATASSATYDNRSFSARDRRVISQCVRDNGGSLPQTAIKNTGVSRRYQKGDVIAADVQRQLRSLPLACDRELPAVSNDLERVVYAGQVMLIDSSGRVVDAFDLTQ